VKCVVVIHKGFGKIRGLFEGLMPSTDAHRGVGADGRGLWLVSLSVVPNRGQAHKGADEV
jgi:hypothetical protein